MYTSLRVNQKPSDIKVQLLSQKPSVSQFPPSASQFPSSASQFPPSATSENVLFDAFDNQLNSAVIKNKIMRNKVLVGLLSYLYAASGKIIILYHFMELMVILGEENSKISKNHDKCKIWEVYLA